MSWEKHGEKKTPSVQCSPQCSTLTPFTMPFACWDPAPILRILLCVKVSDTARGEILHRLWSASGGSIRADYWWNGGGVSAWQSDNCTGPSLNSIKRNVPQSNITWPIKSNIVTATVFGNLYEEKNRTDRCGEVSVLLSVLPPVLPTLRHISARKTASVTGKKLYLTECLWW